MSIVATKFYVLSSENVGPNADDNKNSHTYWVSTEPGITNMSRQVKLEGWLGTTNDVTEYAHGEFNSLEEAKAWIEEELREEGFRIAEEDEDNPDTLIAYIVGRYEEWTAEESRQWCYEGMKHQVTADTTDEQIDEMVKEWNTDCQREVDGTLDTRAVEKMCIEHRDEMQANPLLCI